MPNRIHHVPQCCQEARATDVEIARRQGLEQPIFVVLLASGVQYVVANNNGEPVFLARQVDGVNHALTDSDRERYPCFAL